MPDEALDLTMSDEGIADEGSQDSGVSITTVGALPPSIVLPPGGASYLDSAEDGGHQYWSYGCTVEYVWDEGMRGAPVAAAKGTPMAIWRTHAGFCCKVVSFACQRFRSQPVPPHPDSGSDNEVLIGKVLQSTKPDDMPDQGELFTLVGQYVYLLRVAPGENDALPVPGSPLRAIATNTLQMSNFSKYLLPAVTVAQSFLG